jgi:hypothetical protein
MRTTPFAFQQLADAWYHRRQNWRRAWAEWEACTLGSPEERAAWSRQRAARDALALARRALDDAANLPVQGEERAA